MDATLAVRRHDTRNEEAVPRPEDLDVRAALAEAWILLAPSTYEGFGIPAWEGMGAGAVAVGTPNGLLATVYEYLGVLLGLHFRDPTGGPIPLLPHGIPVRGA